MDSRPVDIVAAGFDAGIRFGDTVERDMVAVRVGPDLRAVIVGAPAYFARHPLPETPVELDRHQCIGYRLAGSGGLLTWDLARDGRELRVRPRGRLVVDDGSMVKAAVCPGVGLGYVLEDGHCRRPHRRSAHGTRRVMPPVCGLSPVLSRTQPTPAL